MAKGTRETGEREESLILSVRRASFPPGGGNEVHNNDLLTKINDNYNLKGTFFKAGRL